MCKAVHMCIYVYTYVYEGGSLEDLVGGVKKFMKIFEISFYRRIENQL